MLWVVMSRRRPGCTRQICELLLQAALLCVADHLSPPPSSDVSRNSEISLQCYLRSGEVPSSVQGGSSGAKDGQGDEVMGMGDIYLGGVKFVPDFGNQVRAVGQAAAQIRRSWLVHSERRTSGIVSVGVLDRFMCRCRTEASM